MQEYNIDKKQQVRLDQKLTIQNKASSNTKQSFIILLRKNEY